MEGSNNDKGVNQSNDAKISQNADEEDRSRQEINNLDVWQREQDEQKMDVDEGEGSQPINQSFVQEKQNPLQNSHNTESKNSHDQITEIGQSVSIKKKESEEIPKEQDHVAVIRAQEEERKRKIKQTIMKLFLQTKQGCNKELCFNRYCFKNPFEKRKLHFENDQVRLKNVVQICEQAKDPFLLLCSEQSRTFSDVSQIDQASEKEIMELIEDAGAFASSFVIKQKKEDQVMKDQTDQHSHIGHIMQMQQTKKISEEDIYDLEKFKIDFSLTDTFVKKMHETMPNVEKLNQSLSSLVDLFNHQFQISEQNPLDSALMMWRGMLVILNFEEMREWEWNQLLNQILRLMNDAHIILRKNNDTQRLTEFVRLSCDKSRSLNIIQKIQNSITISIVSGTFEGKNIEIAVRVLDVFNDANNLKPVKERIEYKDFYNDAINKEVNLKDHYQSWVIEREKSRSQNRKFDRLHSFTLCSFPWILDSANKADLLKIQNKVNQQRVQANFDAMQLLMHGQASMYLFFEVSRSNILDDALAVISKPGINFQKPLRVMFKGEPGIDEGGVRKEFFQLLIKELFNPNYAMFTFNEKNVMYYLNGLSHEPNINFELIGILMALAIYNNIILDVSYPLAIYKLLLFEEPTFDDLREWQPDIAQSLEYLLSYKEDIPLEEALGMTFTIEVENYGQKIDVELKPNGGEIYVTEQNVEEYVRLYVHYTFIKQCDEKLKSFKRGFYKVCDEDLMRQLFKPQELEQLICGSRVLDFKAWEQNCRFIEGYTAESPQAKWLWEIVHEDLNDEYRKKFLAFTTGSDRAPINGLGSMKLYVGRHGEDSEMLPSSHTCFNHLLIPEYSNKEKLKQKLILAISNAEGFGLM